MSDRVQGSDVRRVLVAFVLPMVLWPVPGRAEGLLDPRADPYFVRPELRALLDWVTFRLTFDAGDMMPDMAVGDFAPAVQQPPQFAPGLKGQALVAGDGCGIAIYPRPGNVPLETRGAVSLWLCPVAWTHQNGGNTTFAMTGNASFYLQRQGPMHDAEGVVTRQEGVQYLIFSKTAGNQCLMFGTEDWPPGKWRLLVANWTWPTMEFSLDGGEFQSMALKGAPGADEFHGLLVGASGGEKTLMDELTFYRRPLELAEVRALQEALQPKAEGTK